MSAGKKVATVAIIGAGAGLLYLLFRRQQQGSSPSEWALPSFAEPQGSSPSEWALPSFQTTQQVMAQRAGPAPDPGTWTGNIEVAPIGVPCHESGQCGAGLICINGSCRPESEWSA